MGMSRHFKTGAHRFSVTVSQFNGWIELRVEESGHTIKVRMSPTDAGLVQDDIAKERRVAATIRRNASYRAGITQQAS